MRTANIKTVEQAQKIKANLNKRIESAMDWDTFAASIPSLHIVDHLHGTNQAGLAMTLDNKHKVAVHEFSDGICQTVPVLRSENYRELAHDHVFGTIHRVLDEAGLGHKILNPRFSHASGELHADIVLDKAYKMDEEAFESKMGVHYADAGNGLEGLYRPLFRVKSSFIQSSEIQSGLLRAICSNGMVGVSVASELAPILRFNHVGEVIKQFNQSTNQLITSLFEKNIVENMIMRLSGDHITLQATIEWMLAHIGKQATVASIDQFHLTEKAADDLVSKWVAYNMVTWSLSNVVESVARRDRAQRQLSRLMA